MHERKPAPNDEKDFEDGIDPIAEAGGLGALLIQFPWSFKSSPDDRQYLIGLQRRFSEYPLVVEVRHASWLETTFWICWANSAFAFAISASLSFIVRYAPQPT